MGEEKYAEFREERWNVPGHPCVNQRRINDVRNWALFATGYGRFSPGLGFAADSQLL